MHIAEDYIQDILEQKKIWNEKKEDYKDSPPIWKEICKLMQPFWWSNFYSRTREEDSILGEYLA